MLFFQEQMKRVPVKSSLSHKNSQKNKNCAEDKYRIRKFTQKWCSDKYRYNWIKIGKNPDISSRQKFEGIGLQKICCDG